MCLCPLPTLSLHVQVQIEAQTFPTRARTCLPPVPGTRIAGLVCSPGTFLQAAVSHHFLSLSEELGIMISGSMTCPPAFAPDDARPDHVWCYRVSGLSRCPCLTHDTEKASPAAASIN